jgi:F5/8 type C domain
MRIKVFRLCVFALFIVAFGAVSGCRGKEAPKPAAGGGPAPPISMTGAVPVFSSDLAAGKKWTASSKQEIWADSGKITDEPGNAILFHTKEDDSPWLMIDLETPTSVASVDILNRQDCCGERAIPLVVELSNDGKTWREVARRDELFTQWKAAFSAQDARYVRLRVPRKTYLHLQGIGIHGPGGDAGGTARPKPKS